MTIPPLNSLPDPLTTAATAPRVTAAPTRTSGSFQAAADGARAAQDTDAVTVDAFPASPPPEVLAEMATAAGAADRLAADGRALHFSLGAPGDGVSVQVTDLAGTVLSTAPPSTALAVAAGETLN